LILDLNQNGEMAESGSGDWYDEQNKKRISYPAEDAAQEIRSFHDNDEMSVQCKGHKFRREDTVRFLPISCFHRETYDLRCMITVAGSYRYG